MSKEVAITSQLRNMLLELPIGYNETPFDGDSTSINVNRTHTYLLEEACLARRGEKKAKEA